MVSLFNIKKKAQAIIHITSTLSNTILTLTDSKGNILLSITAGACGFKGSRRSTKHAAQVAGLTLAKKAYRLNIRRIFVKVNGIGYGKQSSIKGLFYGGLQIIRIQDVTSVPFNGCKPPLTRRIRKRK